MSLFARSRISVRETVLFAMLGALMFTSKILMEFLPNVHLLGALTMTYTIVFRSKGLIPIYLYVLINGVWSGFSLWWMPYLYIWTILWGVTMLIPRKLPVWAKAAVYPAICGLHGLFFGTLYAPAQALMFGLDLKGMIAWIIAGFPWDIVHASGNFAAGFLVFPLSSVLIKVSKR